MVINMECLIGMRMMLADNSIDAVVTDPPYGLSKQPDMNEVLRHWLNGDDYVHTGGGFMGKTWDSFVPGPSVWKEVFRVLKPGGHLLAFFGTRTYDLGTLAIRLAGFEIRDQIDWVYGSGFPKSLDVSKAIDKVNDRVNLFKPFAEHYEKQRQLKNLTHNKICEIGNFFNNVNHGGASSNWSKGLNVPTMEQWYILQPLLNLSLEFLPLIERVEAEREIIGSKVTNLTAYQNIGGDNISGNINITAPATDEAKQWQGWGTALKPAHEPICVARKPLAGTVAENVLQFGTGGMNIDDCRVAAPDGVPVFNKRNEISDNAFGDGLNGSNRTGAVDTTTGRFPANFIHDGSDEVVNLFPAKAGAAAPVKGTEQSEVTNGIYGKFNDRVPGQFYSDTGSAARFFYCAKASKSDRDEGVMLAMVTGAEMTGREPDTDGLNSPRAGAGRTSGARNNHPTVKPTALMQWLVRLVTPPGGKVLDPFTGSGSTGKACAIEGFEFIGFEMDPHYCEIAKQRIAYVNNR
ncbi:DNA methyltransferase [Klebsiella phage Kpn BU9]|nr:DNA methyltransferase [Klebsiella phage Kpn BU9]